LEDSDEEQAEDKDMLLVCVLVGEYLSEKKFKLETDWPGKDKFQLHNFCINEGCVFIINSEVNLENESGFFHLILLKHLLQEIPCFEISQLKS